MLNCCTRAHDSRVEIPTPKRWNPIGRSGIAPSPVSSPSSILPPPLSQCALISARKDHSARALTMPRFNFLSLSFNCVSLKPRNLKLCNSGSDYSSDYTQFVLPGCVAGKGAVVAAGARAGWGVAPVVATVAGADAVPETGEGAGAVAMAGADVVATVGVEGAGEAVADLGAAGGSVDVADSVVDSAEDEGPAAVGSADFGPRSPAGRRKLLQPTAAVRRESQAATEYAVMSTPRCSVQWSEYRAVYIQYSGISKREEPCPDCYTPPYRRRIRIRTSKQQPLLFISHRHTEVSVTISTNERTRFYCSRQDLNADGPPSRTAFFSLAI